MKKPANYDSKVIKDFGDEWKTYNQKPLSRSMLESAFNQYFHIFPESALNETAEGFDMGCGSGRWAQFIAPKVKILNCIDPSAEALEVARQNLKNFSNCVFECAPVDGCSLEEHSQDFGYCLGVLHHIPDTESGLRSCASLLKKDAPFLLYLYYRFDNRPLWFRAIWSISNIFRKIISQLPFRIKKWICQLLALCVYLPLARLAFFLEKTGVNIEHFPLADYRGKSFYFMQTDALDRFGTRLEKRFTQTEIGNLMQSAGFKDIMFSKSAPFWVAIGRKA